MGFPCSICVLTVCEIIFKYNPCNHDVSQIMSKGSFRDNIKTQLWIYKQIILCTVVLFVLSLKTERWERTKTVHLCAVTPIQCENAPYCTDHKRGNISHFLISLLFFSSLLPPHSISTSFSAQSTRPACCVRTHTHARTSLPSFLSPPSTLPSPVGNPCSVTAVVLPGSCGGDSGSSAQRLQ